MSCIPEHLKTLEEIEREGISLDSSRCFERRASREEGIEIVRYALWEIRPAGVRITLPIWRNRATEEQKRID